MLRKTNIKFIINLKKWKKELVLQGREEMTTYTSYGLHDIEFIMDARSVANSHPRKLSFEAVLFFLCEVRYHYASLALAVSLKAIGT